MRIGSKCKDESSICAKINFKKKKSKRTHRTSNSASVPKKKKKWSKPHTE